MTIKLVLKIALFSLVFKLNILKKNYKKYIYISIKKKKKLYKNK